MTLFYGIQTLAAAYSEKVKKMRLLYRRLLSLIRRDLPTAACISMSAGISMPVEFVKKYIDLMSQYKFNYVSLASDGRSGVADRDQEISEADRDRIEAAGDAWWADFTTDVRRRRAGRGVLHAGPDPRCRRVCQGSIHHRDPRDRAAGPLVGGARGVSGTWLQGGLQIQGADDVGHF